MEIVSAKILDDDLAVQQQAIDEYIRKVEAEYEHQRLYLQLTRNLRRELYHLRETLEIRRVKMIVGSIAIVLAAAIVAGATGRGPLAPLLTRSQNKPSVQRPVLRPQDNPSVPRGVLKQTPRPALLQNRTPAAPLGRCTNYMSEDGYRRWLTQMGSQPVCP